MKLNVSKSLLVLVTLILLVAPLLIQGSLTMKGKEPYLIDRLSSRLTETSLQSGDELSYSGRPYSYTLGTIAVVSLIKNLTTDNTAILYIPILLGIITAVLFYLIIHHLTNDRKISSISTLILVISPAFIYTFLFIKEFTIPVFLALLAFYLLLKNKYKFLAYILLIILPIFGLEHAIISLIIIGLNYKRDKKHHTIIPAILLILISVMLNLQFLISYGLPEVASFQDHNPLFQIFSDFGSEFGISVFIIFLAIFGLKELWKQKYAHKKVYLSLFLLIILLIIKAKFVIYAIFLLAPLAALGGIYLFNSKWESKIIKDLTVLILVLGLIFSTASFLNSYKQSQPSEEIIESLKFLNLNSNQDSVILSHRSYGIWINSIALRKNLMDEKTLYAPDVNKRYLDSQEIFTSRNLEKTKNILGGYNLSYIYITPEMKQGLVWNYEEDGLLFVLKFSPESFEKIYDKDGIEIWKVKK